MTSKSIDDPRILNGMKAQLEQRQARLDAGEKSLGWKVAFGSPEAIERLGTDGPLIAALTSGAQLSSGATVSIAGWEKPAAESEIAVHMGADLAGSADRATARAAIAALGPAIELADVSFPPDDVENLLARNIYNRHVILGRADTSRAGCVLDGLVGRTTRDGVEHATTDDPQAMTGDVVDIVRRVADLLAASGETLRAGEVIIAGTIVPHVWLDGDAEVEFTLDPIGTVSCSIRA